MELDWLVEGVATRVLSAIHRNAQFAIDFGDELDMLRLRLGEITTSLSSNDDSKTELRKIIYEAEDVLTDCEIRDIYRSDGARSKYSIRQLMFQWQTGRKLNRINSRMSRWVQQPGNHGRINQGSTTPQLPNAGFASQNYDPYEPIGLEKDFGKIKGWILGKKPQRIGIVGMGGLGKTTIARKLFNDKNVYQHFEDLVWVSVSQYFYRERIMRNILEQLVHGESTHDESQLLQKIHQAIGNRTCLIVMDDVWDTISMEWWHSLCPIDKNISVIITSRNEDVIKLMRVNISQIHRPPMLNEKDSWSLFSKWAFPYSGGDCPNNQLEEIGRNILKKCHGLPLAIKTIGGLLAGKDLSPIEWTQVQKDLHDELMNNDRGDSVLASLQMSYDDLPRQIKPCLLCFSIFPEDFEICAEQIVHWWVAEGLILGDESRPAIELGFRYLSVLASRCLIDVVDIRDYDGRIYKCRMHDMVREMTIKIARDEAFCSFDTQGIQDLKEHTRWLGFAIGVKRNAIKSCLYLKALIFKTNTIGVTPSNVETMELPKSLRVLDASQSQDHSYPTNFDWIRSLKRLAYLNIYAPEMSSSIKKLRNLQILVLRGCGKIHPSITDLKRLIVLDFSSCNLKHLPRGIENLVHLQELSGFRLVSKSNTESSQLKDLQELTQLRVLRISINDESEISNKEYDVLSHLEKLKVLAIDAEECRNADVSDILNQLCAPPNLQELYLRHYRHSTMPKWINPVDLSRLHYLCLEEGLISNFQSTQESHGGTASNWTLVGLCLKNMPNFVFNWNNREHDMPSLAYANISYCFNLINCPFDQPYIWRK